MIWHNIDAEEADRLESRSICWKNCALSQNWQAGTELALLFQAYHQKRCPFVIDYLIDLASRGRRRLMIRLVKALTGTADQTRPDGRSEGCGLHPQGFTPTSLTSPVRKTARRTNTDLPAVRYPQSHTLAAIYTGRAELLSGQYEFQCLHGMGEPLCEQVTR